METCAPRPKTVLVLCGYRPVAEWLCRCLEQLGYAPAWAPTVRDAERLLLLLRADAVVAWPATCPSDGMLTAEDIGVLCGDLPLLIVGFSPPLDQGTTATWVRAPLGSAELARSLRAVVTRREPEPFVRPLPDRIAREPLEPHAERLAS